MNTPDLFEKLGQASSTVKFLEERGLKGVAKSYDKLINSVEDHRLLDPVVELGDQIQAMVEDVEGVLRNERS